MKQLFTLQIDGMPATYFVSIALLLFLTGCNLISKANCVLIGVSTIGGQYCADQSQAEVGRPTHLKLTVTNQGTETVILDAKEPVMDITVQYAGGNVFTSWSAQQQQIVNLNRVEFKPNQTKTIELTWIPKPEDDRHFILTSGIVRLDDRVFSAPSIDFCVGACTPDSALNLPITWK